jgi:hypothetical protein
VALLFLGLKLNGLRTYLVGAMDRAPDGGVQWRENITPFLEDMGVTVFDPCKKERVVDDCELESLDAIKRRDADKRSGNFDELTRVMKDIRSTDLRFVDTSDFLTVNLDLKIYACGTWEEIVLANRQKKPIVIHVEQGKENAPDWLFGMVPHDTIFSHWHEVKAYISAVDEDWESIMLRKSYDRWVFLKTQAKAKLNPVSRKK